MIPRDWVLYDDTIKYTNLVFSSTKITLQVMNAWATVDGYSRQVQSVVVLDDLTLGQEKALTNKMLAIGFTLDEYDLAPGRFNRVFPADTNITAAEDDEKEARRSNIIGGAIQVGRGGQ